MSREMQRALDAPFKKHFQAIYGDKYLKTMEAVEHFQDCIEQTWDTLAIPSAHAAAQRICEIWRPRTPEGEIELLKEAEQILLQKNMENERLSDAIAHLENGLSSKEK